MAGILSSRAAKTLRDPWSLLVAGVGAGSAWAVGVPMAAAGLVGAGMLVVAAAVRQVRADGDGIAAAPEGPALRAGTVPATLVTTLQEYRIHLDRLRRAPLPPAIRVLAGDAVEAARSADLVAHRVAVAIEALDDAVARAERVARELFRPDGVKAAVRRMRDRRTDLLAKLTDAVDAVGEAYAKLLELTTTADILGIDTDAASSADRVNDALDAIRTVFAELDADAWSTRAALTTGDASME